MIIFPAIDLKDKKVVRLTQGDYNKVDVYNDNPCEVALSFEKQGATHLHVVDLDGAKDGALSNYEAVKQICENTNMFVEIGGGIRDENRVEKYINLGVGRVILGTAALKDPKFLNAMVKKYKDKIAVGVDAKDGYVATEGWLDVSDKDSVEFCKHLQKIGVQSIIYTDISKDGAMQGINEEIYKTLNEINGLKITASGGVSTLQDIENLCKIGVHSAIVGKAIYIGALNLKEVLQCANENSNDKKGDKQ